MREFPWSRAPLDESRDDRIDVASYMDESSNGSAGTTNL